MMKKKLHKLITAFTAASLLLSMAPVTAAAEDDYFYEEGGFMDGDWDDGDSCWGFYVDSINDIDFSKDEDVDVFDATGHFVGDEWTIPELVIRHPETGEYLASEFDKLADGTPVPAVWTQDLDKAYVYRAWNIANNADIEEGKKLWKLFDYDTVRSKGIIKDKDALK